MKNNQKKIAIIGAGLSGTCVLAELLHSLKKENLPKNQLQNITIDIIEKSNSNGSGYAYEPKGADPKHLLNQTAKTMSVQTSDENGNHIDLDFEFTTWKSYDFVNWLKKNREFLIENHAELLQAGDPTIDLNTWQPDPESFYVRPLFGMYLQEKFNEITKQLQEMGVNVNVHNHCIAIDSVIKDRDSIVKIKNLENNKITEIKADKIHLAVGALNRKLPSPYDNPNYFDAPYPARDVFNTIKPSELKNGKTKKILVKGTSLSAIDSILSVLTGKFYRDNHNVLKYSPGKNHPEITAYSRSGFFPIVRVAPKQLPTLKYFTKKNLDSIKERNGGYLVMPELKELFEKELAAHFGKRINLREYFLPKISTDEKLRDAFEKAKVGNLVFGVCKKIYALDLPSSLSPEDRELYVMNKNIFYQNLAAMPFANAEKLLALFESGVLKAEAIGYDNPAEYDVKDDGINIQYYDKNGDIKALQGDYLINATGYKTHLTEQSVDPFVQSLLRQGQALLGYEKYHDPARAALTNYTFDEREAYQKAGKKIEYSRPTGLKVEKSNYALLAQEDGKEAPSKVVSAFGLPVMYWAPERDIAALAIDGAQVVVKDWMKNFISKNLDKYAADNDNNLSHSRNWKQHVLNQKTSELSR